MIDSPSAVRMHLVIDFNIKALLATEKAKRIYEGLCDAKCHCDHNIDQSLTLLSTGSFRRRVLKAALAG